MLTVVENSDIQSRTSNRPSNENSEGGNDDVIQTSQAHPNGEVIGVPWKNMVNLIHKKNRLSSWKKCYAEILRSMWKFWIPWRGRRVNYVMIGSDCHDACTRLNTESCSLHAFVTCRLSYIVVGMHITEASHAKSEHMWSISNGNESTTAQMKAIEREVVSHLVNFPACNIDGWFVSYLHLKLCMPVVIRANFCIWWLCK